jgi:threonylcarbamoyladenosine tRNA methylthiotransferase MtaB
MDLTKLLNTPGPKTFLAVNFGCRVNAAETNQFSQILIQQGLKPDPKNPSLILVNTCSITKKANIESLGKIRQLHRQFPKAQIIVTGCAKTATIKNLNRIQFLTNPQKEDILKPLKSGYTPKVKDKFSHTRRFILKIQSGCNHFCSYCVVPYRRPKLWSLPINDAVNTVSQAVANDYQELIITGINLNLYQPGLSNLIAQLLNQTKISLISFGSIPLNCIDDQLISLYLNPKYAKRLSHFLHIPLQSGSTKILKLMNRPYTQKQILNTFDRLKTISDLQFGTDIIVGFPGETDKDFQETQKLCQSIGFYRLHVFKFSPRPGTAATRLYFQKPLLNKEVVRHRSQKLRTI